MKTIAYHITFKHLIEKILAVGLIPNKPTDVNFDEVSGVFLFRVRIEAEDALMNWFGDRVEEMEENLDMELETIILTVDITGLDYEEGAGYEWICNEIIPPNRILKIEEI